MLMNDPTDDRLLDEFSLSRGWWEHLSPKAFHGRFAEIETVIRSWCNSEYGRFWLSVAREDGGVIRLKEGQFIPIVHVIGLADRPFFVAPLRRLQRGHRMVGRGDFASNKPLVEGEIVVCPTIRVDLVTDKELLAAVRRHDTSLHVNGVTEPSSVFSVSAHLLLAPTVVRKSSYVLYQHIFGNGASYPDDGFFYVGVTTRSWKTRWAEHRRAMRRGSTLLFHRTLRDELHHGRVTYIHHKVMAITDDVEKLYATEQWLIGGHWDDKRRLNMIQGSRSRFRNLER